MLSMLICLYTMFILLYSSLFYPQWPIGDWWVISFLVSVIHNPSISSGSNRQKERVQLPNGKKWRLNPWWIASMLCLCSCLVSAMLCAMPWGLFFLLASHNPCSMYMLDGSRARCPTSTHYIPLCSLTSPLWIRLRCLEWCSNLLSLWNQCTNTQ